MPKSRRTSRFAATLLSAALLVAVPLCVGCASASKGGKHTVFSAPSLPKWAQKDQKPKKVEKAPGTPKSMDEVMSWERNSFY